MHYARPIIANVRACKVLLAIAATLAGSLATAAEDPTRLDEITVTARRTEERLLDVPIAVTAVSAETLEQFNVKGLRDLSMIAPSFYDLTAYLALPERRRLGVKVVHRF